MDTSNNAREHSTQCLKLHHVDLRRQLDETLAQWCGIVGPEGLANLVKANSKGCDACASEILRRWGVR